MDRSVSSIFLILFLPTLLATSCTHVVGGSAVMDQVVERSRRQENPVTREYPLGKDELWQMVMTVCEKELGIHSSNEENGSIETEWITEEYRPEETPPGFLEKMRSSGAPTSPNEVRWCGMKHKFLILILDLPGDRSRIEVRAGIKGYNYGYQMWRWWNSKGTLERAFLEDIEMELQSTTLED